MRQQKWKQLKQLNIWGLSNHVVGSKEIKKGERTLTNECHYQMNQVFIFQKLDAELENVDMNFETILWALFLMS